MADTPLEESQPAAPAPRSEADILADPRLRAALSHYQPLFHEQCLRGYAAVLADLARNGQVYESNLEYLLHQHEADARTYLWMIQHQKLFDLECQWRAGLVEVPDAQLTADFEDWHDDIAACPVLPPITAEELATFDAFLAQLADPKALTVGNPGGEFWLHRRYPGFQDDDDDDQDRLNDLTEWTQFWDLHRGTGYLRTLPDRRGELEHRYERAAREARRAQQPPAPATPQDPRPHAPTYGPDFDALVREWLGRYEPAVKRRQFDIKEQLKAFDAEQDVDDLPLALERLQNAGRPVPIGAHADWRIAVIEAANRHYLDQLRASLPQVYEDYCQRESLGIQHPEHRHEWRIPDLGDETHFDEQAELIREGRRALNEPDDLNF
ncbi:hypothetical protein [Hymenobacter sp. CRA2]|uniref:hypothetical protein n=1 Tax=Hymenobacter sp. CRA2 TaxID=1955620 RepID=UPI00098E9FCB|nr:hypothetical protein [Hymenobacter sp. CRA2]OON67555.1 hypothetical protein B0919_17140 [Hymenobacter sp. CRA2]